MAVLFWRWDGGCLILPGRALKNEGRPLESDYIGPSALASPPARILTSSS